jgi:hypothetical protein
MLPTARIVWLLLLSLTLPVMLPPTETVWPFDRLILPPLKLPPTVKGRRFETAAP